MKHTLLVSLTIACTVLNSEAAQPRDANLSPVVAPAQRTQGLLTSSDTYVPGPLPPTIGLTACPIGSVPVGNQCVDTYEASVWVIPPSQTSLIQKIRSGIGALTVAELIAAGARQKGVDGDDYSDQFGVGCGDIGNGCTNIYAVSLKNVLPSRYMSWYQANAACRNAGKRLLTSTEWETAAQGTPQARTETSPSNCRALVGDIGPTGTPNCRSDYGVADMEGNVWEWVADLQETTHCAHESNSRGSMGCLADGRVPEVDFPTALYRGGRARYAPEEYTLAALAGRDFTVKEGPAVGVRCAR